ncbi:MAG: hypothetical protein KKA19_08830 [Candidatus Margulisbacteria bacterium]|nr:hypothetical protein [Candidatus Margulisiibacteriota bacterium]
MKKIIVYLILSFLLASASSASIILQTQANTMGPGLGAGFSIPVVPMLLDLGVEYNQATSPWSVNMSGSYTDNNNNYATYDGNLKWRGKRYGVFAKLNFVFITPIIHAGTQEADISLDGDIRIPGTSDTINEVSKVYGSYISIGIPFYIGPVFIEPSFGTQSIYIPDYANYKSVPEFQLAFGVSLL